MKRYVLHAHMTMTMMRPPQRKWCWCGSSAIAGPCTRATYAGTRALGGRSLASRRWSARWALRSRAGILIGSQVGPDPGRTHVLCQGLRVTLCQTTQRVAWSGRPCSREMRQLGRDRSIDRSSAPRPHAGVGIGAERPSDLSIDRSRAATRGRQHRRRPRDRSIDPSFDRSIDVVRSRLRADVSIDADRPSDRSV